MTGNPPASRGFSSRQIVILGLLSAVGPIGVDIYLPAFPAIAADLGVEVGMIQLSMASYFVALGLGQLPYGILSDRIGRKRPILLGLAIFVLGSLVCALTASAALLIAGRFVQGIGICAILSIMRAIIRDVSRGRDAAHVASRMLLIVSISPLLAPMIGSALIDAGSWRLIFWLLAVNGAVMFAVTALLVPETGQRRVGGGMASVLRQCGALLRSSSFTQPMLLLAAAQAGASVYLAGSSAVYLIDYGISPWGYSFAFALNAVGMIMLAQANRRLIGHVGVAGVTIIGTSISAAGIFVLLAAAMFGHAAFPVAAVCFFLFFSGFGLVMGPASVLALEDQGEAAGVAAGLLGTVQFIAGAGAAAIVASSGDARLPLLLTILSLTQFAALATAACRVVPWIRRSGRQ